jgi:hypothetical protein
MDRYPGTGSPLFPVILGRVTVRSRPNDPSSGALVEEAPAQQIQLATPIDPTFGPLRTVHRPFHVESAPGHVERCTDCLVSVTRPVAYTPEAENGLLHIHSGPHAELSQRMRIIVVSSNTISARATNTRATKPFANCHLAARSPLSPGRA